MTKKIKEINETDDTKGHHKNLIQENNITVDLLKDPSIAYAAKLKNLAKKDG